jgi:hypothetical protein
VELSFTPPILLHDVVLSLKEKARGQLYLHLYGSLYRQLVNGEVLPVLHQVPRHEDVWGSGGIAPRALYLAARWREVDSFTRWHLYHRGKIRRYPVVRRLGGP